MNIQEITQEQINLYLQSKKIDISSERITKGKVYLKQFDILISKVLGNGQFGIVFKGYDLQNSRFVAIKLIFGQNEQFVQEYINEAQLARQINSKYVVKMYDQLYDQENKNYFIIYEFCEEGNLQNYYKKLNQQQILDIFIQLAKGLQDIHAKNIIHSDLKPDNILLAIENDQLISKIGDLGLSKKLQNNLTHISTYQGTYSFMAYEQTDGRLCMESDYFALGSIICFISGINLQDFMTMSLLKLGSYQDNQKNPLITLALELMKKEPSQRMKLDKLLSNLEDMKNNSKFISNNKSPEKKQYFNFTQKNIMKLSLIVLLLLIIFKVGINIKQQFPNKEGQYQIIDYQNGTTFSGYLKNKLKHGTGEIDFNNGVKYIGEFKNDKFNGEGKLTLSDGSKYEGEFKDNLYHGEGFIKYNNGSEFIGHFKQGKYHGQGKLVYNNKTIQEGEWKDGEFIQNIKFT